MAIGDIIREIASLGFDESGGTLPKIIHIAGTTYAIAYQGYGNDVDRTMTAGSRPSPLTMTGRLEEKLLP